MHLYAHTIESHRRRLHTTAGPVVRMHATTGAAVYRLLHAYAVDVAAAVS